MGEEGFSSDSSLLYHRNLPSRIVGVGRVDSSGDLDDHGPTIRSSRCT